VKNILKNNHNYDHILENAALPKIRKKKWKNYKDMWSTWIILVPTISGLYSFICQPWLNCVQSMIINVIYTCNFTRINDSSHPK